MGRRIRKSKHTEVNSFDAFGNVYTSIGHTKRQRFKANQVSRRIWTKGKEKCQMRSQLSEWKMANRLNINEILKKIN